MEYYIRMSLRQWLALFVFYAMYVLLGTSIFYTIEHNLETERRAIHLQERIDINGKLVSWVSKSNRLLNPNVSYGVPLRLIGIRDA